MRKTIKDLSPAILAQIAATTPLDVGPRPEAANLPAGELAIMRHAEKSGLNIDFRRQRRPTQKS